MSAVEVVTADVQPRVATYACDSDIGTVTVENNGSFARMTSADGSTMDLAAVPESGGSRFSSDGTAIVLEGPEMLLMPGRHEPANCRR